MKEITCFSCNQNNFILELKCKNCGSILHEKYNAINLGELIYISLFDPKEAAKRVLFSSKKNYLLILLFLFVLKFVQFTSYDVSILDIHSKSATEIYPVMFLMWFIAILILNLLMKFLFEFFTHHKISVSNVLSITVYPFLYSSISLFIIFPLELMLFGPYLFSKNPGIFEVNYLKAVSIVALELIILLYSMFLFYSFLNFVIDNRKISLMVTVLYFLTLYGINKIIINMGVINL